MFNYSVVQWVFFFYFYCFFGWCFESAYVSIKSKKKVNRGFMRGPFLPLYGSGAIMMLLVSKPFEQNLILVYVAGCVGATILEYVTGVVMEALFKVRYWDYSYKKFQFQGHICLSSTLAWGGLTILMTVFVHRWVENAVFHIPEGILTAITFVLTAVNFADFALAFKAAMDLRDILVKLEKTKTELAHLQKRMDVLIALTEDDLSNRREEIESKLSELRDELFENLAEHREELLENLSEHREAVLENIREYTDDMREDFEEHKEQLQLYVEGMVAGLQKTKEQCEKKQKRMLEEASARGKLLLMRNPSSASKHFKDTFEAVKQKIEERLSA